MRIAIDARELSGRATGVGRYVAELLRAWDTMPGALTHEFVLCAAGSITTPPTTRLRVTVATAEGSGPWWEQRVLPRLVRQTGADVLFAPAYSGPLFPGVPMVVTVHDVVELKRRGEYLRAGLRLKLRYLCLLYTSDAADE